jgi:GGDEF domain-containing protein
LLARLVVLIAKPYLALGHVISVSASVRVTPYAKEGAEPNTFFGYADEALYVGKDAERNCYRIYSTATKSKRLQSSADDR